MGDRFTVTVLVHDVPPEQYDALVEWLDAPDIGIESAFAAEDPSTVIGASHYATEVSGGEENSFAETLEEMGASFEISVDAKYEYDGETIRYAPGLGYWRGFCLQDGRPSVSAGDVNAELAAAALDPDGPSLEERISRLTGAAWDQRFAELEAARGDSAARDEPVPAEHDHRSGRCLACEAALSAAADALEAGEVPAGFGGAAAAAMTAAGPACGAAMPIARTRCVLPVGHAGPHRSVRAGDSAAVR